MKVRDAVGAFIRNTDGKYLVVEGCSKIVENGKVVYCETYWDILRGGIERGEDAIQALKRELSEELGIKDVVKMEKLNLGFCFDFPEQLREKLKYDGQRVELFLVELDKVDGVKIDNKEVLDCKFLNEKDFLNKLTFSTTKNAFKEFITKQKHKKQS